MPIFWKPTGSMDINSDPTELPEKSESGAITSGAMSRCKNIRLTRQGIAQTRYGITQLDSFSTSSVPELLLDAGGHRYIFTSGDIYYDEVIMSNLTYCEAPAFSPVAGFYTSEQTVTITSSTSAAIIRYTLDGTTPNKGSTLYTAPVFVSGNSTLKAYAYDSNGRLSDSDVTTGYYGLFAQNSIITETASSNLITETDENTITTEGP